jgi:4-coumarate--CoA ligase
MRGYWGNEKATRDTLLPDGWLKTGDVAYVDDNGKWFIVDRKKAGLVTTKKQ